MNLHVLLKTHFATDRKCFCALVLIDNILSTGVEGLDVKHYRDKN